MYSVYVLIILSLSINYHAIEGIKLSKEEFIEYERQLKILNKQPIQTVQDEFGDIFDCVDINKQPAFDHPLLKNHKVQMEPTLYPNKRRASPNRHLQRLVKDKSIGCTQGTVPIRRTRMEDLLRVHSFLKSINATSIHPTTTDFQGQYRALFNAKEAKNKYFGVEAIISVNNPRTGPNQLSAGKIWAESGTSYELNFIHAGWAVAPWLFGDKKSRLFINWRENENKYCYINQCPGFVQVDQYHPIGQVLQSSIYDGEQSELALTIQQDKMTQNWWLMNTQQSIFYGYWPKEVIPYLSEGASWVGWGGMTMAETYESSPPMGSGYFPDDNYKHTAYFAQMMVVNENFYKVMPEELIDVIDVPNCYTTKDMGYTYDYGYSIMYGGPGGNCGT